MRTSVARLTAHNAEEVIAVLADAFSTYPVMRYVLGPGGSTDGGRLHLLVRLFVMARVLREEPMLGGYADGRLVAAAIVSDPAGPASPPEFLRLREEVWEVLGKEARARYDEFGAACQPLLWTGPHIHLNMIGVRPVSRRLGLAAALLERVHEMATTKPGCEGVTLTTEDPANLPFYAAFGYSVTGHAVVGPGLESWAHFRRNPVRLAGSADG